MIYVDDLIDYGLPGRMKGEWCHMMSDESLDELHQAAAAIGLKRSWFQNKRGSTPHYDLTASRRRMAVANGAKEINARQVVGLIRLWRTFNKTP